MTNRVSILISVGLLLTNCHRTVEAVITPVPAWKLRTDIFLDNKVLLGAHATDERLVVAGSAGFYLMRSPDTSFVQNNSLRLFGTGAVPTLNSPLLSNSLYVSTYPGYGRSFLSFFPITPTIGTSNSFENGWFLYLNEQTGIAGAYIDAPTPNVARNWPFGAYNETTKALLYRVRDSNPAIPQLAERLILMQNQVAGPDFIRAGYNNTFRSEAALSFATKGVIAVKDYFIVSPYSTFYGLDGFLWVVDAKLPLTSASVRKIPIAINTPDTYFFYQNHLYGYTFSDGELVRSDDGGFTWRKLGNIPGSLNFSVINNNLIAYRYATIVWLDDGSETFTNIRELNNTGLDFSQITGLAAFQGKVFATTLSGLYALNTHDFLPSRLKINHSFVATAGRWSSGNIRRPNGVLRVYCIPLSRCGLQRL